MTSLTTLVKKSQTDCLIVAQHSCSLKRQRAENDIKNQNGRYWGTDTPTKELRDLHSLGTKAIDLQEVCYFCHNQP